MIDNHFIKTNTLLAPSVSKVSSTGLTGKGILIGHLDTGVDHKHPALTGKIKSFAHFDENGLLSTNQTIRDTGYHGTHTAGIICGSPTEGRTIGIAPDAKLSSAVVIEGGQTVVRVLAGLEWMLDQPIRILLMALGLPGYNPILSKAIHQFVEKGVLVIAPVGNAGIDKTRSPANYPHVLAVGAADQDGRVPRFSASGQFDRGACPFKPDLVAPGVNIPSAAPGGGFRLNTGTSMAAAYVAGVSALLFEATPTATAADVTTALKRTAGPLSKKYAHRAGYGLVNPLYALDHLKKNKPAQHVAN